MRKKLPKLPQQRTVPGRLIAAELRKRRMTIYRLSQLSGLTTGQLHDIVAGAYEPKVQTLAKIAKGLGIRVRRLLPDL